MNNPSTEKHNLQLNNRGASLLVVIFAFLFLATLGTIIVSSAVKNIEMKTVDKKTKENFYLAEAALDEIKIGLAEDASKEITKAYNAVLSEYSTKNAAMRNVYFNRIFTEGMQSSLSVCQDPSTGIMSIKNSKLTGYLKETKKDASNIGAEVVNDVIWQITDGKAMTLKNVMIRYCNGNYSSKISTDIKIMYPCASFQNLNGYVEPMPFIKYALIAQDSLLVENAVDHNITGSVYAGDNGINVSSINKTLKISNGRIISKGNIKVMDKANFMVDGTDSEVWATNLITDQLNKSDDPILQTSININGTCYIKDDLVADAKNSSIILTGQYYGYSSGDESDALPLGSSTEDSAGNNSAITINAANSLLNLDGLSELYLAGRAFINLDNSNISYKNDDSYGLGNKANSNILTGESISVKGSQEAYLVPSHFIKVGHNPVSWDEYKLYYNKEAMVTIPSDAIVFSDSSISEDERKISYYLNSSEPYKKVFYKFSSSDSISNMVYYYLNFASEDKATTYLKNFRICYPDIVYNGFPIKEINLNKSSGTIVTAGNLVTYDTDKFGIMEGNNGEYLNDYAKQYNNLSQTLQKFTPGASSKTLFDTLIKSDVIKADASSDKMAYEMNDPYYVRIKDGDFSLDEENKSGIIIATGNVTVNQSFTGMIIAGGTIELCGGANVDAAPSLVTSIINSSEAIKKYFVELSAEDKNTDKLKTIKVSDLIVYENWKKN